MSEVGEGPPAEGWYAIGGEPNDLAYFDGQYWTWRGRRDATGTWQQEPIVPPSPTAPTPLGPSASADAATGLPSTPGSPGEPSWGAPPAGSRAVPSTPYSQLPAYPGEPWSGSAGAGQWEAPPPLTRPPGRLDLLLPEPGHQARWKTLLRLLLVLPNVIVLGVLEIAVFFVTIAMWFCALFTARVPQSLWGFSIGVLKWQARTNSFLYFLTDRYPPFTLGDAEYPVSLVIGGPPDRFNRFSVLFRVVLVIPAWVVVVVFSYGVGILSIFTWLLTLIAGRCPRLLYLVIATWLRYDLRFVAFNLLLTTEYPGGPLGDSPPFEHAASLENGDIVLTGGARALAVVTIVIGVLAYIGLPRRY